MRWVCNPFKNWKCTEWPQTDLGNLTVKSGLYALSKFIEGQIVIMWKVLYIRYVHDPDAKIVVHFAQWPAVIQIYGFGKSVKSEMHRIISDWPWMHNIYTPNTLKKYPTRHRFVPVLLYKQSFSRYKVGKNSEMHRMSSEWPWTFSSQE